jgi:hypothetical protein
MTGVRPIRFNTHSCQRPFFAAADMRGRGPTTIDPAGAPKAHIPEQQSGAVRGTNEDIPRQ